MKNNAWKRIAVMVMCLLMLAMVLPARATEAVTTSNVGTGYTKVKMTWSKKKNQAAYYGGETATFYVKTNKPLLAPSVKLTMSKGTIQTAPPTGDSLMDSGIKKFSVYGCYDIHIYYQNDSGKWVKEQDLKAVKESSKTIKFDRKNTFYKVEVYFWKAETIFNKYKGNGIGLAQISAWDTLNGERCWSVIPTVTAENSRKCIVGATFTQVLVYSGV